MKGPPLYAKTDVNFYIVLEWQCQLFTIGLDITRNLIGVIMLVGFKITLKFIIHDNFLEVREFITQSRWQSEGGGPCTNVSKQNILSKMNSSSNDRAGITYCLSSDMIELWYTQLDPFQECGHWVVVPGIHRKFIELEMTSADESTDPVS